MCYGLGDQYDDTTYLPDMMRRYTASLLRNRSETVASYKTTASTQTTPTLLRNKTVRMVRSKETKESQSREIFLALVWACIILRVWMHSWLLQLLPIPALYIIIKRIWQKLNISKYLLYHWSKVCDILSNKFQNHFNLLFPKPLRWCTDILWQGDRKVS